MISVSKDKEEATMRWQKGHNPDKIKSCTHWVAIHKYVMWKIIRPHKFFHKSESSGLLWWLSNKESSGQCRRHGFDPWSRKIPTCCGATKPMHHNYQACAIDPGSHNYWAHMPQLLKPALPRASDLQREATAISLHTSTSQLESSPHLPELEKRPCSNKYPAPPPKKNSESSEPQLGLPAWGSGNMRRSPQSLALKVSEVWTTEISQDWGKQKLHYWRAHTGSKTHQDSGENVMNP